jgi:thymidylate synthase
VDIAVALRPCDYTVSYSIVGGLIMAALTKRGGRRPGGGRPKSEEERGCVGVSIAKVVLDELKANAKSRRLSVSYVVEEALREFLKIE